jgi:arabinogalactan endo-1,4-beta-galactosidase
MKNLMFLFLVLMVCCSSSEGDTIGQENDVPPLDADTIEDGNTGPAGFFYGADLSYVNEMLDCGAVFKDYENVTKIRTPFLRKPVQIWSGSGSGIILHGRNTPIFRM